MSSEVSPSDGVETSPTETALALHYAGQDERAQALLAPWLAGHPDDERALLVMSDIQLALGQPALALRAAHAVLARRPTHARALMGAARAESALGHHGAALDTAARAVQAAPTDWGAHMTYARTAMQAGNPGNDALPAAREAVRLDPTNPALYAVLGDVQRVSGLLDDATASYRVGLKLDPQNIALRNNLALIGLRRRRPVRTVREFVSILETHPQNAPALSNLRSCAYLALHIVRVLVALGLALSVAVGLNSVAVTAPAELATLVLRESIAAATVLGVAAYCIAFVAAGGPPLRRFLVASPRYERALVVRAAYITLALVALVGLSWVPGTLGWQVSLVVCWALIVADVLATRLTNFFRVSARRAPRRTSDSYATPAASPNPNRSGLMWSIAGGTLLVAIIIGASSGGHPFSLAPPADANAAVMQATTPGAGTAVVQVGHARADSPAAFATSLSGVSVVWDGSAECTDGSDASCWTWKLTPPRTCQAEIVVGLSDAQNAPNNEWLTGRTQLTAGTTTVLQLSGGPARDQYAEVDSVHC